MSASHGPAAVPPKVQASTSLSTLTAPAHWRTVDFISDLHLADDTPKAVSAWADFLLNTTADAVFILGDLFEVWVGDDSRHDGFEAHCAAMLAQAAAAKTIGFMAGNRDFLLGDEMLQSCGVLRLADPTVLVAFGQRVLLTHGDAWCVDDVAYQAFRLQVRDPAWQTNVLSQPLPQRRLFARHLRSESERQMALNVGSTFDVDTSTALLWMDAARAPTLIHGHTHRPGSNTLAPDRVRHVLSDWELDSIDPTILERAEVLRWHDGHFERLTLHDAQATRVASA